LGLELSFENRLIVDVDHIGAGRRNFIIAGIVIVLGVLVVVPDHVLEDVVPFIMDLLVVPGVTRRRPGHFAEQVTRRGDHYRGSCTRGRSLRRR